MKHRRNRRKRKSNEYQKRSHIKSAVPERRRDPSKAGDYFQKAVIELGEARVRKAIEFLKASLFHDRQFAESHALLGMAYICLDRNRLGINHCNEASRLGLANSMCMLHLIAAHGRLGHIGMQRTLMFVALQRFPEIREDLANCCLGVFYHHWHDHNYTLAKCCIETLIQLDGSSIHWTMYAECCLRMGLYQEAYENASLAINMDPSNGAAYQIRGKLLLQLGYADQAILEFSTARANGYHHEVTDLLKTSVKSWAAQNIN